VQKSDRFALFRDAVRVMRLLRPRHDEKRFLARAAIDPAAHRIEHTSIFDAPREQRRTIELVLVPNIVKPAIGEKPRGLHVTVVARRHVHRAIAARAQHLRERRAWENPDCSIVVCFHVIGGIR